MDRSAGGAGSGRDRCLVEMDGELLVSPCAGLSGELAVPGDKSVAHRALMLAALCDGPVSITGLPGGADVAQTRRALGELGVVVEPAAAGVTVHGRGLFGLGGDDVRLDCGRSGTTMRLLAGLLAGQERSFELVAHPQLAARPMARVVDPLRTLGARIESTAGHAPLSGTGGRLAGGSAVLDVASAQVATALLFAHLTATGPFSVTVPAPVRDHTERMLVCLGAPLEREGLSTHLAAPIRGLSSAAPIELPGDPSSAAFLVAAAAACPGSELSLVGVGLNPGRSAFLDAVRAMGGIVTQTGARSTAHGEPVGDLTIQHAPLRGIFFDQVAGAIDELPLLAVLGCFARGTTEIRGASELRVKESDRIGAIVAGLAAMGADIEEPPDGFRVRGPTPLTGAGVDGREDHRIVMALAVAGLAARDGETRVRGSAWIADSFPEFTTAVNRVARPARRERLPASTGPS
jgi:3-phosphoshikimate 1-carboxyvinyltransferase